MPSANLSAKKKRQWQHVYDSAKAKGDDEATAHKKANGVVGRSKKDFDDDTLNILESKGYIDYAWEVEGKRLSQEDANYKALGGTESAACLNCHWFIPSDDACVIVAGDIYHTGISDYWMAQEAYTPEPLEVVIVGDETKAMPSTGGIVDGIFKSIRDKFTSSDKRSPKARVQPEANQPIYFVKSGGRTRYFTRYSNAFKDREKEFISTVSQKEYVEWCDKTGFRPELWLWHTKGSRLGKADIVGFTDGIAWASGLIDDNEFATKVVDKLSDGTIELGASHGYWPLVQIGPVVLQHRTIETTVLPRVKAANWWTDYNWLRVKELGLKPEQKAFFQQAGVPDELIEKWASDTETLAKALQDAGLEFKEISDDAQTNAVGMVLQQQSQVSGAVQQLAAQYKSLSETVEALKKSDDAKIDAKIAPAVTPADGVVVGSQSDDNIIAKDLATKEETDPGTRALLENMLGIKIPA